MGGGGQLNFIIDHRLESLDALYAILPIIIGSHIFTENSPVRKSKGIWFLPSLCICPRVKPLRVIIGFPYIIFNPIINLQQNYMRLLK